jgi:hypothetical protein
VSKRLGKDKQAAQLFSLPLAVLLGLALFLSPYRLHNDPTSIFFVASTSATTISANTTSVEHSSHSQHHEESKTLQCLRCVLYGFQLPETATPFLVILVVLGFLKLAKPAEPFSFITLSNSARAPPVSL